MSNDNPFSTADVGGSANFVDVTPVPLDVGPILSRATDLFTNNVGVVLGAVLLPMVPAFAFGGAQVAFDVGVDMSDDSGQALMFQLASLVVQIMGGLVNLFFQLGVIRIFLNLVYGQPAELGMLISEGRRFASALGTSILVGLAVFVGILFLIIPGIILGVGLQFAIYVVVDRGLGPIDAMKESWRLTDGHKLTLFLVNLVIGLLGLAFTCVTLGLGYILIVPVMALVQAVMYQSLRHMELQSV